ncbi:MAG: hypothetical protein ACN4EP_07955 [Sediminibacterium sp.]
MNTNFQLQDFFSVVSDDIRITVAHISLYLALVSEWQAQGNPIRISVDRARLMILSKINARQTYDRCMHDLHAFRYINYLPKRAKGESWMEFRRLV